VPDPAETTRPQEAELEAELQGTEALYAQIINKADAVLEALLARQEAGEKLTASELIQILQAKETYGTIAQEIVDLTDTVIDLFSKTGRGFPRISARVSDLVGKVVGKEQEIKKKIEIIDAIEQSPEHMSEVFREGFESEGIPPEFVNKIVPAFSDAYEKNQGLFSENQRLEKENQELRRQNGEKDAEIQRLNALLSAAGTTAPAAPEPARPNITIPIPEPTRPPGIPPLPGEPFTPDPTGARVFTAEEAAQVRADATAARENENVVRMTKMKEAAALVGARFSATGGLEIDRLALIRSGSENQRQFLDAVKKGEGSQKASEIERIMNEKKIAINRAASQLIDQAKLDVRGVAKMKSDELLRLFAKPPQTLKDSEKWLIRSLALFAADLGWIDGSIIPAASSAQSTEFGKAQVAALNIALEQLKTTVMKDGTDNLEAFFDVNEDKFKAYFSKLVPTASGQAAAQPAPAAPAAVQPEAQPAAPLTLPALQPRSTPAPAPTEATTPVEKPKFDPGKAFEGVDLDF
jgi:hypothetical protein